MVSVISMLILIYGDELTNTYYTRDNDVFKKLITKYGYSDENYQKFIDVFDKYYSFDLGERTKPIKKKNKFFNPVQKCLIDMLVAKNNKEAVKIETIIDFYESLFTIKNKNFFKKTYTLMTAYNPYEIDEYFKKQGLLINEQGGLMEKITINNKTYEIIKDENKVIDIEELTECITLNLLITSLVTMLIVN